MSTAVIQKGTAEEIEQLLAAKQETGLWEKSYNCLLQEHEVFQNDLMELQDKLVGMQKEYENSQKELLSCSKSCSIKVSYIILKLTFTLCDYVRKILCEVWFSILWVGVHDR